ncbi:MAG: hypothetical protein RQ732_09885 [Methylophaga sp.]|nr:hypothetical protein [Methylophaga sp.]
MTDFIPAHHFDDSQLQQRLELFRYADLTQPLMQTLFALQLPDETINELD